MDGGQVIARDLPEHLFRGIEAGTIRYTYRGASMMKNPVDLAILTRLIWDAQPRTIVEVGSHAGGSALWLLDQVRLYSADAVVWSVDLNPPRFSKEGITFVQGDGRNLDAVFNPDIEFTRPLMVIDDADHYPQTTAAVLDFFARRSLPGEYVVVEDGDAEHYYPGAYDGGPLVAIREFLGRRGGCFEVDRGYADMFGITFNPDGYIRRVA